MKKKILPLATGLFLCLSQAQAEDFKVTITPLSPDYPVDRLKGSEYQGAPPNPEKSQVLEPALRDKLLNRAGLTSQVASWDHLEKDLLVLRARHQSLNELKKRYPEFAEGNLSRLQELVREPKK